MTGSPTAGQLRLSSTEVGVSLPLLNLTSFEQGALYLKNVGEQTIDNLTVTVPVALQAEGVFVPGENSCLTTT